jgi:hypothetical protein
MHSRFILFILIFILFLLVNACAYSEKLFNAISSSSGTSDNYILGRGDITHNDSPEIIDGTYSIDPIFRDLYLELGGYEILGPAISPAFISSNEIKQYVETGLLVYDDRRPVNDRFALAPLGKNFGITGFTSSSNDAKEQYQLSRDDIYPMFLSIYEKLGGARFVGRPLTHARHNGLKGRIEQYFENLGFFILDGDESEKVRLMAYGAFACDRNCRFNEDIGGIPNHQPVLPEPFATKSAELGMDFTGRTLTGVYTSPENNLEVIFENIVLIISEGETDVMAKPILGEIGFKEQSLFQPMDDPLMVFVPIEAGKGHNVPVFFMNYLNDFGGLKFAGLPISEVYQEDDGTFWQCFENMCVEFFIGEPTDQKIKPAPLGINYKQKVYDQTRDFKVSQSFQGVGLKIWEGQMFVSAKDSQEIFVKILQSGLPLTNREPILYLTLPDGSLQRAYFPPTDSIGRTKLTLAPLHASNGTLIAYQVCLEAMNDQRTCVGDSFLVWNSD